MNTVALGFVASLAAGLLTAVGALPVLFGHSISRRQNDVLLGFAAGVMLSASFFSLIMPGIEFALKQFGSTPNRGACGGHGGGPGRCVCCRPE